MRPPLRFGDHFLAVGFVLVFVAVPAYVVGLLLGVPDGSAYWTVGGALIVLVWLFVWARLHVNRPDPPEDDCERRAWFYTD
jgi:membrane protein implicated in regulation of membrane protease activity